MPDYFYLLPLLVSMAQGWRDVAGLGGACLSKLRRIDGVGWGRRDLCNLTQISEPLGKGSILGSSSGETSALGLGHGAGLGVPLMGTFSRTTCLQTKAWDRGAQGLERLGHRGSGGWGQPCRSSLAPDWVRVICGTSSNWKLCQDKWHVGHVLEELMG